MENFGCYYLHIFYPSKLYLIQERPFEFELDEIKFAIKINNQLKSLIINDFDNKLLSERIKNETVKYKLESREITLSDKTLAIIIDNSFPTYLIDFGKHLYKDIYSKDYTELIVLFECTQSESNHEIAMKALDYFINSYRIISEDVLTLSLDKMPFISRVTRDYFYTYSSEELNLPREERIRGARGLKLNVRTCGMPFWNTQGKVFATDEKKNATSLSNYFSSSGKPDMLSEFILKAREELYVNNNYKYSFLESWTVLEIAIVNILNIRKIKKGISKKKMDDFEKDIGISYLLNIELPLTQEVNDGKFKALVSRVNSVRKLRNDVIHKNRGISLDEAREALDTTIDFLDYMNIRKTKY